MNKNIPPLAFRIKSLNNQIKRLMERRAMEDNHANLTGMQYAFLGFLGEQDEVMGVYQKDVETEFNIRRSTTSEMLKNLERQGYIVRISDPIDTRMKKITLTEKAKKLNKIARANLNQLQARLTKDISAEEMEQFLVILKKISDNAQD